MKFIKPILFLSLTILAVFCSSCSSAGDLVMPTETLPPVPTETPEPTEAVVEYKLVCEIDENGYGFAIEGETGESDIAPKVLTEYVYASSSSDVVSGLILHLNWSIVYPDSGHEYKISGKITLDKVADQVTSYDIEATGDSFNGVPQTCVKIADE